MVLMAMNPHRAVMVVDMQRAFEPPEEFVGKLGRYVSRFPCRIFTRFVNPADSMFRKVLKQKCCAPRSMDTKLLIQPREDDLVFEKRGRYGLSPAQLRNLHSRKIKKVTVCGLDTDACVLAVMFSLFDAGIECHLKEDMCWSSSGLHKPAVRIARAQFKETR